MSREAHGILFREGARSPVAKGAECLGTGRHLSRTPVRPTRGRESAGRGGLARGGARRRLGGARRGRAGAIGRESSPWQRSRPSPSPAARTQPPARPSGGTSGALGPAACTPLRSAPSASFTAPPRDPQAAPRVARADRRTLRPLVGTFARRVPPPFVHRASSERATAKARSQRVGRLKDGPSPARARMDRAAP